MKKKQQISFFSKTHTRSIKILHQNIQCISNKLRQLEVLIDDLEIDFLLISEHWLTKESLELCTIENMNLLNYFCRINSRCGGVCIYGISSISYNYRRLSFLDKFCVEGIFECCGVDIFCYNIILIAIYRVPNSDFDMFLQKIYELLEEVCCYDKTIIMGGDYNINFLKENNETSLFLDLVHSFNCNILIKEPTRVTSRSQTCIDNIVTNSVEISLCNVVDTHLSDHYGQLLTLELGEVATSDNFVEVRNMCTRNVDRYIECLQTELWATVLSEKTTDDAFDRFAEIIKYYFLKCFPIKRVRNKAKRFIKLTPDIQELKTHLSLVANLSKKYPIFKDTFRKLNQRYIFALNELKKKCITSEIERSDNKQKTMWKLINNNLGRNIEDSKIRIRHNDIYLEDFEVSNAFNLYFSSVTGNITKSQSAIDPNIFNFRTRYNIPESFFLNPVTTSDVEAAITKLKNSHSSGFDCISNSLLKTIKQYVSIPLAHIINLSYTEGIFPKALKHVKVIPVFKKGSTELLENYRPISLISSFSKVIEAVVNNSLLTFLTAHKILQPFQHGFLKGKDVNTALDEFLNIVVSAYDKKHVCMGLFIDFKKAFDCIDHALLLNKLEIYGIRGVALQWFTSYLTDRTHCVDVGGAVSDTVSTNVGVPQGSILGPTLFLIYLNDLAFCIDDSDPDVHIINYADDTNVLITGEDEMTTLRKFKDTLMKISHWSVNNKLYINDGKTSALIFSKHTSVKNKINTELPNLTVSSWSSMLGLVIDENLTWNLHIDTLCKKLARTNFALNRLAMYCNLEILRCLYFASFQSILKYGIIHWGRAGGMQRVFILQKRAIRTLAGISSRDSCRGVFRSLGIMTAPSLYICELLCFAYNNKNKFGQLEHDYSTRYRDNTLLPSQHRSSKFQRQSHYNACKAYNHLSDDFKALASFIKFKKAVKEYLIEQEFYTVKEFFEPHL